MKTRAFFLTSLLLSAAFHPTLKAIDKSDSPTVKQIKHIAKRRGTKALDPALLISVRNAASQLEQYRQIQEQAGIQNADIAYGMRKAIVIADLMLDEKGLLNLGLVPAIKSVFISETPLEYEANIGRVLDQLDSSWQTFFNQVVRPSDSNTLSNLIIRALLSLKNSDPISDRSAKVALLASMLAPYNQGPVGDCFAVCDLIRDHDEYFMHTAKDIAAVIQTGYLTRTVNNASDNFFFLPILADSDRDAPFNIDYSGQVVGTGLNMLSIPGIVAACNIMGANQINDLSAQLIKLLFGGSSNDEMQVTASQIIQAIAKAIAKSTPSVDQQALIAAGQYAFSSLTNNTVLKCIECAFAAMAEDRPTDSTRGNINSAFVQAISPAWVLVATQPNLTNFKMTLANNFNASYRLIYNPDIPLAQVSADGSSSDGGFQMFRRDSVAANPGTRVATPQDFRLFVLDMIATTKAQIQGSDTIASQLVNFVRKDSFLQNLLWDYDPANQQESDPVANYQNLSRTPMQSCDGDNPYEVDDIDTGKTFENSIQTHTVINAADLISWAMGLAKQVSSGLLPMDSPQHAFNFMPGNPDLAAFVHSGKKINDWLKQTLLLPGMKVALKTIDANTQTAVANAMYPVVSKVLSKQSYQELISKLGASPISVQKFAQGLVTGINHLLNSDANQAGEVALIVDAILIQSLPSADRSLLQQSAIRFAFTNWNDSIKDIYFCAYFNPRTGKVGFGTIDEDKTNLQPMDEQAWVNNQQWDVDLRPAGATNSKI